MKFVIPIILIIPLIVFSATLEDRISVTIHEIPVLVIEIEGGSFTLECDKKTVSDKFALIVKYGAVGSLDLFISTYHPDMTPGWVEGCSAGGLEFKVAGWHPHWLPIYDTNPVTSSSTLITTLATPIDSSNDVRIKIDCQVFEGMNFGGLQILGILN